MSCIKNYVNENSESWKNKAAKTYDNKERIRQNISKQYMKEYTKSK